MARSKSFFGLRRGSTKTLTFSVLNGEQITKDRVSDVKNPRSAAQMKQRCFLKTAALGYATMKAIVDHSFEGFSYGSQSMRRFMQLNTPLVMNGAGVGSNTFGFAAYGDSTPNMGQFIISHGSLSAIPSNAVSVSFAENSMIVTYQGGVASASALAKELGCNLGDIATVCALVQNTAGDAKFVWLRLILPTSDVAINAESTKLESDINFSVAFDSNVVATINFDAVDGITADSAALYGVIRSQKSDSGWLRSKASLNNVVGSVRYLDDYSTALLSYPQGQAYILNGGDAGTEASEPIATYGVNVANDTAAKVSGTGNFKAGTLVRLTATNVPSGYVGKWANVPTSSGSTQQVDGNSCSFSMPEHEVNINFSLLEIPKYSVSVTNSTSSNITGEGQYAAGAEVTLQVTNLESGKTAKWENVPDGSGGFKTVNTSMCKFTMPAAEVTIAYSEEVIPSSSFTVTVDSELASQGIKATPKSAAAGQEVTITNPNEEVIVGSYGIWTEGKGQKIADLASTLAGPPYTPQTFTMPSSNVVITSN